MFLNIKQLSLHNQIYIQCKNTFSATYHQAKSTIYYLWAMHPFCRRIILWQQFPRLAPCRTVTEQGCIASKVSSVHVCLVLDTELKSPARLELVPHRVILACLQHTLKHMHHYLCHSRSHPPFQYPV